MFIALFNCIPLSFIRFCHYIPLFRSKWEGVKCLAIFFTHFFDKKILEEVSLKLKSTVILQEALNRIYKVITHTCTYILSQ